MVWLPSLALSRTTLSKDCKKHGRFVTLGIGGLTKSKHVPGPDMIKLNSFKSFNSPLGNFKKLRVCLEKDTPPLVPVLGFYTT